MESKYVDVKDVIKLFDQLYSWDKVKFLEEILDYGNYVSLNEINDIVKSYSRRHGC